MQIYAWRCCIQVEELSQTAQYLRNLPWNLLVRSLFNSKETHGQN
jgi:hypothetical protein